MLHLLNYVILNHLEGVTACQNYEANRSVVLLLDLINMPAEKQLSTADYRDQELFGMFCIRKGYFIHLKNCSALARKILYTSRTVLHS